jgi:hypothetical protein
MNSRIAVVVLAGVVASPALAQSHDPSTGSINKPVITAPVGHRQPRAADVPATNIGDDLSAYPRDAEIDRVLRSICRRC